MGSINKCEIIDGQKVLTPFVQTNSIEDYYSTEEEATNKVWIDGKRIYRRVFTGLSYGNGSEDWQTTGITISDVSQITSFVGIRDVLQGLFYPTTIRMNGTSVEIYCTENISPRATGAIVEYTKSTN